MTTRGNLRQPGHAILNATAEFRARGARRCERAQRHAVIPSERSAALSFRASAAPRCQSERAKRVEESRGSPSEGVAFSKGAEHELPVRRRVLVLGTPEPAREAVPAVLRDSWQYRYRRTCDSYFVRRNGGGARAHSRRSPQASPRGRATVRRKRGRRARSAVQGSGHKYASIGIVTNARLPRREPRRAGSGVLGTGPELRTRTRYNTSAPLSGRSRFLDSLRSLGMTAPALCSERLTPAASSR